MARILFTLQTSKIFPRLLPAQNYLSIMYHEEMRICLYYYPADILAVWKCSAAKNETHKNYIILTQQFDTTTTMEDEIGERKGKKKIYLTNCQAVYSLQEAQKTTIDTNKQEYFFYCKIPGIFLHSINSLNRNRKHFNPKKQFILHFLRTLGFLWTSHQHILAMV